MKSKEKNKQLAEKIILILQGGLAINADTLHYIDSTFSNPSVSELEEILQDDSSCEKDSLIELLFFPDESIQCQLEVVLADFHFFEQDEKKIENLVCRKPFHTYIRFPDGRGELRLAVAPPNLARFITRLNISRNPEPKLTASIDKFVPEALQARCRVRLRNTKPIESQNKILFVQAFFEKIKIGAQDFFDCLDFTLSFIDELKDESDMFTALTAKKKFYFQNLQKAKNLDAQLQKHNVETLLLRGKRVSYIDKADARKKIQIIDQISLAVFGKTAFFDPVWASEQSINLEGKEDIDKLIKEWG